jgi:tetratricopeptide (TPR) repeat protein
MIRRLLLAPLLLLLLGSSAAQMRTGNLHVRITFTNGQPCTIKVRVQLMLSAGSTSVAENYTNDQGLADFDEVEIGNYHLVISGEGIEQTDSGMFEVDNRHGTQFQTVTVRRTEEATQAKSSGAMVAVQDMNIPKPALKQFNKASDLIASQDWKKALDRLNRALAIYPGYVQAYNNLGVVYGRLGDRSSERTALQKAVSLNDHFAPAWVNLARMAIVDRDFPSAETLLEKATGLDPTNSETLLILANVELMNLHYQQAIANCQKAHSLGQDSHSLVHFIAARAFEHESQIPKAVSELKTFLKEEPSGIRADAARKELTSLQRLPQ